VKGKLKPNYMHVVKHGTMVKLLVQKKKECGQINLGNNT